MENQKKLLGLFGLEADVIAEGADYMKILFIGNAAMSFRLMADGIMQASGDAITPMKIAFLFRFIHVAISPFFIFGWWIFPQMGVSGAAMGNVTSQSMGMVIGLWFLFSGRSRLKITLKNFHIDPSMIWRIVKMCVERAGFKPKTITTHTIRKAFRKIVRQTDIDDDDKEQLMGHVISGSRQAYYDQKDVELIKKAYQICNFQREVPESEVTKIRKQLEDEQSKRMLNELRMGFPICDLSKYIEF